MSKDSKSATMITAIAVGTLFVGVGFTFVGELFPSRNINDKNQLDKPVYYPSPSSRSIDTPANDAAESGGENFLIGTCVIPDGASYETCTTQDLLGAGEVSTYFIFRDKFVEVHIASVNNAEDEQDGIFTETVKKNPAVYRINGNEISVVHSVNSKDGPCLIELIYRKEGNELLSKNGATKGNCDRYNSIIEQQNLLDGLQAGQYRTLRFTINN